MTESRSKQQKLQELYELIDEIETAMLTTRRADGHLVTRPMATQAHGPHADLWFVTDIHTHKIDEIETNPQVCVGYYSDKTKEWVSVSGRATITQDRKRIHELHRPDWKVWFPDEGGLRNGGPNDPRLALIFVDAEVVTYSRSKHSRPVTLLEIAKGFLTGETPDISREEHLTAEELG